jgi:hypothetical protein
LIKLLLAKLYLVGKVGIEGVAQAFEDLGSPERHAKIIVEPWRRLSRLALAIFIAQRH